MINQRIAPYPATGVALGITDLEKNFGNMILNKFPKGFIQSYHFDDKMNIKTQYKNERVNIFKNTMTSQYNQQKKPRLTIIYNNTNANQEDAAGGMEQPTTYPLVQGVHPELNGYIPIYKDPNGICIYMSHKRIKVLFNVIVEVESLADQENVLNYIENLFKMQYGSFMEFVPANFILPNDMINTIYKVLYAQELLQIPQEVEDKNEQKKIYKKIGEDFYNTLKKYSSCNGINQYNRNNNPEDNYFLYRQIYRKIYYEVTRPEKTDGEKIGSIYGKYTVTFDGFMEFEKPVSYILVMPDVVAGNSVTEVLKTSGNIDYYRDHNPAGFMKYYGRRETLPKEIIYDLDGDEFEIIYKEEDITMDSPNDIIDIVDWMGTSEEGGKLKYYASFMKNLTENNFKDYFHIYIYDNIDNTPVDRRDIKWDGELLRISNTDPTVLYKLYVLGDKKRLHNKINRLIEMCGLK